jgi:hypothetical protein
MQTTQEVYHYGVMPLSKEKSSFMDSFTRLATDDGKRDRSDVQHYIDVTRGIRNYESLNAYILWVSFVALSRLEKEERALIFSGDLRKVNQFLRDEAVQELITRITSTKNDEKTPTSQLENLKVKMTTQLYKYIRLILAAESKL